LSIVELAFFTTFSIISLEIILLSEVVNAAISSLFKAKRKSPPAKLANKFNASS